MQVNDIEKFLNEVFPPENALDYDNVGLIAGNRDKVVSAILVSLDLTSKSIQAAKACGANLIVTHHPIIFGGIKALTMDDYVGRTLVELINSGISVISCHTNLDLTDEFGNLAIAELLGAKDAKHLDGAVCGVYYELDSEEPVTLKDYCRKVASDLKCSGIITINDPQNKVNKVFIQGGSFDEDSVDTILQDRINGILIKSSALDKDLTNFILRVIDGDYTAALEIICNFPAVILKRNRLFGIDLIYDAAY